MPVTPLPWNRFGVSVLDVFESKHFLASKADISFAVTKVPPYFSPVSFMWRAIKHRNALVMGIGDPRFELDLVRFIRFYWCSDKYDTTAFLVDRRDEWEHCDQWEKPGFARIKYSGTFPELLEDILKFRDDILFRMHNRPGTPPFQVLLLPMNSSDFSSLTESEQNWKNFLAVLSHMMTARLYVWVLVEGPGVLPDKLCKFFDLQVFYGQEAAEYAARLYPDAVLSRHDPYRKTFGLGRQVMDDGVLYRLSALGQDNISEWGKSQQDMVVTDEEELYRRFLESLEG